MAYGDQTDFVYIVFLPRKQKLVQINSEYLMLFSKTILFSVSLKIHSAVAT